MEYSTLGRTGARVSHLGFGGAVLGLKNYLNAFDPADADDRRGLFEAVEVALESGINLFDTAAGYGNGESERVLGEALAGVREAAGEPLFLSTKLSHDGALSPRQSLERSLGHLGRDHVDLVQIHGNSYTPDDVERILAPGGIAEQMQQLKAEGLTRFIGFTSEDDNGGVDALVHSGVFDTMQICYNFIFQHPYEPSRPFGALFEAEKQGMGILTMRAPTSGTFQRWIQMVNPENTFDYTPALIQFVLSNPLVDVALAGMRDAEIVRKNVAIVADTAGRIDINAVHTRYV
ncbi:aldo/keto reductase [Gryllotalpicola reticulitermitis]|uniref:Aldo/keto reductase n=1 Tax=Gryllotalpicola reticulitermitis TaxID=1184153 RepID=A0ABV8Q6E8_9MICO